METVALMAVGIGAGRFSAGAAAFITFSAAFVTFGTAAHSVRVFDCFVTEKPVIQTACGLLFPAAGKAGKHEDKR